MHLLLILRNLFVVRSKSTSEAALLEVVLDGTLLGSGGLGECDRSTEGTGKSAVLELGNTGVGGASDGAGAGHASWHLDGDGEVHGLSSGETANADAWDVRGNGGCKVLKVTLRVWSEKELTSLECGDIRSSGCGVSHCGQWAGAILIDLVEVHCESSIISGGWETGFGTCTLCCLDTSLGRTGRGRGSARCGSTLAEVSASYHGLMGLTSGDGGGAVGVSAHEERDHGGGIDGSTTVGSAESGGFACAKLVAAYDGGIGLSSAAWGRAVTRSSVSDWKFVSRRSMRWIPGSLYQRDQALSHRWHQ